MNKHAPEDVPNETFVESEAVPNDVEEQAGDALAFLALLDVADEVSNVLDDVSQTSDDVEANSSDIDQRKIDELMDNLDPLVEDDSSEPNPVNRDFYVDLKNGEGDITTPTEFGLVGELHRQIFSKRSLKGEVGTFLVLAFRTTPIRSWPKDVQERFWSIFDEELKNFKRGLAVVKWEILIKEDRGVVMHKMDRLVRLSAAQAFDILIHQLS